MNDSDIRTEMRCGYVAIIGKPNVGKSTLLNAFMGQKISIVSAKPQTTRHRVLGILSSDTSQIIFLDTPGLLQPKYRLHETMMNAARSAILDANLVLLMIEAGSDRAVDEAVLGQAMSLLTEMKRPVYLVINKIDLVSKDVVLETIARHASTAMFREIYPISALKEVSVADLLKGIAAELPLHPPLYPPDIISEHPEKFFVSELVREKIFEKFRDEVPYSTTVEIIEFTEAENKKDVIRAEIYVERDSQKGILIGKQGAALKELGTLARKDIEEFLGRPVFLDLHIKVREHWRDDEAWLRRLGYES